jgi:hypothetical protein
MFSDAASKVVEERVAWDFINASKVCPYLKSDPRLVADDSQQHFAFSRTTSQDQSRIPLLEATLPMVGLTTYSAVTVLD